MSIPKSPAIRSRDWSQLKSNPAPSMSGPAPTGSCHWKLLPKSSGISSNCMVAASCPEPAVSPCAAVGGMAGARSGSSLSLSVMGPLVKTSHEVESRERILPDERDMTSACTFCSSLSDLWAEILNDAKCASIPWHNIHDLSRRCRSSDAKRGGDRYPTMTASPAVNASVYLRLAIQRPWRSRGYIQSPSHHHPPVVLVRYVACTSSMRSIAAPRHILAQPAAKDANNSCPPVGEPAIDPASVLEIDSAFAQSCVKMGRWSMRRRYRKLRVCCVNQGGDPLISQETGLPSP